MKDASETEGEGLHNSDQSRPAMLYVAETWAAMKRHVTRIEVNEMKMPQWICGVTLKDKIRTNTYEGREWCGL